jgi:orotate phosphoribosyltransferase
MPLHFPVVSQLQNLRSSVIGMPSQIRGVEFDGLFRPSVQRDSAWQPLSVLSPLQTQLKQRLPSLVQSQRSEGARRRRAVAWCSAQRAILAIDDVVTAGTAVRESVDFIREPRVLSLCAFCVAVDRQERGQDWYSWVCALAELAETFALVPISIVTLDDILAFALQRSAGWQIRLLRQRIEAYRAQYGAMT